MDGGGYTTGDNGRAQRLLNAVQGLLASLTGYGVPATADIYVGDGTGLVIASGRFQIGRHSAWQELEHSRKATSGSPSDAGQAALGTR